MFTCFKVVNLYNFDLNERGQKGDRLILCVVIGEVQVAYTLECNIFVTCNTYKILYDRIENSLVECLGNSWGLE